MQRSISGFFTMEFRRFKQNDGDFLCFFFFLSSFHKHEFGDLRLIRQLEVNALNLVKCGLKT